MRSLKGKTSMFDSSKLLDQSVMEEESIIYMEIRFHWAFKMHAIRHIILCIIIIFIHTAFMYTYFYILFKKL